MPEVSVLVPIYNVEPYLRRCIDSVLAQSFTDWEMILVDDGSPDACPIICDEYATNDSRIRVVHKCNGGLVSARRAGVEVAKGRYYMFLDSDDWLMPDAIAILYSHMAQGYDMVRGGAWRVSPDGVRQPLESYKIERGEVEGTESFLVNMYVGFVAPYLWGALYKSELFDTTTFDGAIEHKISLGEDKVTNLIAGLNIKKALYIEDKVYCYFFNTASIMSTKVVSSTYGERLERFIAKSVFLHYPVLQEWQQAMFAIYCFRNCFVPSLGFSSEYDHYVTYLTDKRYEPKIRLCIESKYLLFAKSKTLYRIYTAIYRWAYHLLKGDSKNKVTLS